MNRSSPLNTYVLSTLLSVLNQASYVQNRFKAEWLLYIPPGFAFKNCTLYPQKASMCFLWFFMRKIIPLQNINYCVL